MCRFDIIVYILCYSLIYVTNATPSYIKPCSRSAADFKQCCVDHGNEALPHLIKGDKQLKIPKMLPLKFPTIDIETGPNLKFKFNDVDFYGIDSAKVTDMDIDFGQLKGYVAVHADYISLIGQYDVDGRIMILPLTGKGPANITIEECLFKYSFSFKTEIRNGKGYAKLNTEDHLDYDVKNVYFKLDNLFSGNKQMGDEVNKFLNDNNREVLQELDGILTGTISTISKRVGGGVLENIPFDDLFLL